MSGRGEDSGEGIALSDNSSSPEEELEGVSSPRCFAAMQARCLAFASFFCARMESSYARFISRCLKSLGKEEPRRRLQILPNP